jgi:pimeloyl-ACP methyl ester carboxylesterase
MKYINRLLIVSVLFIWSCSKSETDPQIDPNGKLVSVNFIGKITKAEIVTKAQEIMGPQAVLLSGLLQNDVNYYKISYKTTTTDGRELQASGGLMLPISSENSPLVSIQHGTIFEETDAPSYFKDGREGLLGIVMASAGYHTVMPDYVGYGDSKAEPHPYEHGEGLAVPVVDLLFAFKEYAKKENVKWNNNVLLGGYSAGGYATLAAQKLLEEKYSADFKVKATSCGAGAYNKSLLLEEFINKPTSGNVSHNRSYIWVLQTYNRIYKLNRPITDFFKEPYATQIAKDGHNVSISGSFNTLLNPAFIQSYKDGKETKIVEAFKANDLVNWKTNISTLLIHGDADTYVPYINATTAYQGLKAAGSPNVTLETVPGGTHESSITTFIFQSYALFANNRN